jgi:hypothetical protein
MNCDHAFEALTDPSQCDDLALSAHLAECPRCRDLKAVLEPALFLLCGDLPHEPSSEARGSQGPGCGRPRSQVLSEEVVRIAEQAARVLAASSAGRVRSERAFARPKRTGTLLRSAALVLFGAFAAYGVTAWQRPSESGGDRPLVPIDANRRCSRREVGQGARGTRDPRGVLLSCASCHLRDAPREKTSVPTLQIWPVRRSAVTWILFDGLDLRRRTGQSVCDAQRSSSVKPC